MEARRREARERMIGFRGRIVGMHEAGQSIRAIANDLGISTRTVRRWIRRAHPGVCTLGTHDVDLLPETRPVKQPPYRVSPGKKARIRSAVQYLHDNHLI
ncbi:hypothetical protein Pcinc_003258 [Petrolisthes cinctipes]|uniref:Uncharacterized protein n=1 Tax=Petrolisthes cinctipes TaxID=88211 RepID=A0AAE1GJ99_PETCI|nr:hypothetical protein Pcinc_003258 [Petrolisthes cinctipes]